MGKTHLYAPGIVSVLSVMTLWTYGFAAENTYHLSGATGAVTAQDCLKCHDGTTGRPIKLCLGNQCLYLQNHSMLHPYPPLKKAADYASRAEIEAAGCILENGRVTCLSCHNLTRPAPHLIKDGSDLCYICHKNLRP